MAKNKKKKNITGITSSIGGDFDSHSSKSGKKRPRPMTAAREAVRREIREIISDAKEAKNVIKRKVSHVAKNGIKDLKIDGSRLMEMMKGLKMKESPTESKLSQQSAAEKPELVRAEPRPKINFKENDSYYDKWFKLINSELNRTI
jgi:hypothetical protein